MTLKNYYEKIRASKQEKLFHEVILQIGNCQDMNAKTSNGELAVKILDEYMRSFQTRNIHMRVFSAHLHMDEATPHLHIDFIPFTTGSKRGLDTRVSLKQALSAQGFKGGSRNENEWNQWVLAEKEQLSAVMERHGVEWEQKGTKERHLSILDYEKKMRAAEVAELETKVEDLQDNIQENQKSADEMHMRLIRLQKWENLIGLTVDRYDNDPKWKLPEPKKLMTSSAYKNKMVVPFVTELKTVIRSIVAQYIRLKSTANELKGKLSHAHAENERLVGKVNFEQKENAKLYEVAKDFKRVRNALGNERTNSIIEKSKAEEKVKKRISRGRGYGR